MGQVKIGREFFANAKKDYTSPIWAYAREIMQNSIDAPGCDRIDIDISELGNNTTRVVVTNDGEPMTEEILVGKLLTLGASGKRFNDQDGVAKTGGFGKAKELLYFSQVDYGIVTGDLALIGEGGEYEIERRSEPFAGTCSTVTMEGNVAEDLEGAFRRFCQFTQWSGSVYLNGERLQTNLKKGSHRRDFAWCKIFSNRQHTNVMVVRINGTPMFTKNIAFKGCVVVELEGKSDELLSANRDSLLWRQREELDSFCTQLAIDKRSALRQKQAEIKLYAGEKLKHEAKQPKVAGNLTDLLAGDDESGSQLLAAFVRGGEVSQGSGVATEVTSSERVAVSIGPEFLLKNTTGMVTPDYYTPGPQFSDYSRKLALAWAKCLLEVHKILEMPADFSIGFCLDEDSGAEYSRSSEYGTVYYINPARLVSQKDKPQCRSFRAAFTGAWADRFEIIALAAHEVVHGMGFSSHDEDYSSKLTEVCGKLFANLGRLTPLFRG